MKEAYQIASDRWKGSQARSKNTNDSRVQSSVLQENDRVLYAILVNAVAHVN